MLLHLKFHLKFQSQFFCLLLLQLLIGFETGAVVLWDLKGRVAENRYNCSQPVRCVSWHYEGRQFIVSHTDGTLTIWNVRNPQKPANVIAPHGKKMCLHYCL